MLLSEKTTSSESKYLKLLEEFFNVIFEHSFLPSHGIGHHKRVWYYAKEILRDLDIHGFELDESLSDKLIIASFLHDTGMSVDPSFRHGFESRRICERFLKECNLPAIQFSDVLDAVENHDNKEYLVLNNPGDLLTILSVADDLDAFGFIGIYRYLEIYIARNKPLNEIGNLIIENSEIRFNHFLRTYGFDTELVEKHSDRYKIINSFLSSYNQQVPFYKFDNQMTVGYCGVAEIINQRLNSKLSDTTFDIPLINCPDPVVQWFFSELKYELAYFNRQMCSIK